MLLLPLSLAADWIAVRASPLPDPATGAPAGVCLVTWTASALGVVLPELDPGCPAPLRGPVEAAARAWVVEVGGEGPVAGRSMRRAFAWSPEAGRWSVRAVAPGATAEEVARPYAAPSPFTLRNPDAAHRCTVSERTGLAPLVESRLAPYPGPGGEDRAVPTEPDRLDVPEWYCGFWEGLGAPAEVAGPIGRPPPADEDE